MKPADKRLCESLKRQVTNLHMYWKVYRQLYANSQKRVDLLNETGPLVFYILQHLLIDEVTLALCRLTDPARSAGKATHSLTRLIDRIDGRTYPALKRDLQSLLSDLKSRCQPFRDRRNKAIAHSDLGTTLKITKAVLPGVSRQDVEEALKVVRKVMNRYEQEFKQGETAYEHVILPLGADGDFLIEQLKRAVAFRDLEKAGQINRTLWTNGRYKDA